MVKETARYDNFMEKTQVKNDDYIATLDRHVEGDELIADAVVDHKQKESKGKDDVYKTVYMAFRNLDDLEDFCKKINQSIPGNVSETYYPLKSTSEGTSFLADDDEPVVIDRSKIEPKKAKKFFGKIKADKTRDSEIQENAWPKHWKGMPEFKQEDNAPYRKFLLHFRTKEDYKEFGEKIEQEVTEKSKSLWHPKLEITKNLLLRWIQPNGRTNPRHPCYIVSKGRSDTMITSRSLARMEIPHYIVVEPQDMNDYDKALDNFKIRPYVTLLEAPFSNHGDGPGRARNWAWDHSISIGATSHWVFDDNITDFYRLHNNKRIRFESGVGFQVMEDFVDRYDNVYIAGPQYRFFIAPDSNYPPFVSNTRIYSCLLIRNDTKHRWRGRYNEDTDICLRVLKDGDVCVQFNAFLQGKAATQTVKGGNTAEFYHAENTENDEFKKTGYNVDGTINKSQMLVDMHPDVATLVWKYGRWHHFVDYTPFKVNKLKLKEGVVLPEGSNEYGMELVTNFDWKSVH